MSCCGFFFKQKTAYEMRISDWSSDVCSSDLGSTPPRARSGRGAARSPRQPTPRGRRAPPAPAARDGGDRKSVGQGKRVSVRVYLGGRRIIKKKKQQLA